jgi:DNA-binding response OmpR family regulator
MTATDGIDLLQTVLVADDDPDLLALIQRRLTKAGYRVICAIDGQQALDLVAEHQPDMAVLDVTMPKVSGTEVLARLRADRSTAEMLIILISANYRGGVNDRGRPQGADDYIPKPFGPGELRNRVELLFDR